MKLMGLLGDDVGDMKRKHYSDFSTYADSLPESRFSTFEITVDEQQLINYQKHEQDELDING